ncbi:transposable element Tcb1 transposase [Trichonephila clavipes]|nr:transposable element Tcb1 transposase [Trichonephila clavipes]
MVVGAISFDNRTPLGVIRSTLTAQWYVNDILKTVFLPFLLHYTGRIFSEIVPERIRHVFMNRLTACQTLSWPTSSPDLTPI